MPRFRINMWKLRFEKQLEDQFRIDYFKSSLRLYRIVLLAGFIYYGAFIVLDLISLPESIRELSLIRFGIVCPTILLALLLSFTPGFHKYWQIASAITTIIGGVAIVAMTVITPELGRNLYYVGIIEVLIYNYILLRLKFHLATVAGWIIVASYALSLAFFPGVPKEIATANLFFLITCNILGMFGGYSAEYYTRREFFYKHLLKKEQQKVSESNLLLEQRINEKTMELQQDIHERERVARELIIAKEKAEESDRLKSAFLANMSHEIRTPMNGIIGFSSLLKNPDLSMEKRNEFISIIQKSGDRMLETINDLINVSKIEAGLVDVFYDIEDIQNIGEDLYNFFKHEAELKGLNLSYNSSLPREISTIETDKEKVTSIITNLVKNAIKYTLEGEIEFGFFHPSKDGHDFIEFYIRDTGIGIASGNQELIFDRFAQADSKNNRVVEGSGLGLSITRSYVEMLGGRIWVESKENIGSTFHFTIPFNPVDSIPESPITLHRDFIDIEQWMMDKTILITEDDPHSALYLEKLLSKSGASVNHVENGEEALEYVKSNPNLSLIMMDLRMPVMDGYTATREIRKINRDVLIIAQSAYAMKLEKEIALDSGCDAYLTKPIDEKALMAMIRVLLKNRDHRSGNLSDHT